MDHLNMEIKARVRSLDAVRRYLTERGARFVGTDRQRDTYFWCPSGRLKIRRGNIENALIFYRREDLAAVRASAVRIVPLTADAALDDILASALGIRVVVAKTREIYFVENVKFHLDSVENLGEFLEIEAIGTEDQADTLRLQCEEYLELIGIDLSALVGASYSELLDSEESSGPVGG